MEENSAYQLREANVTVDQKRKDDITDRFKAQRCKIRAQMRMTQAQLGEFVGLNYRTISKYEQEGNVRWVDVCLLAEKLCVDVTFFLGEKVPGVPLWHVLDPKHATVYIEHRNLSRQRSLRSPKNRGDAVAKVRQFGTRLPIRIMDDHYFKIHKKEVTKRLGNDWKKAMKEIYNAHRDEMDVLQEMPPSKKYKPPIVGIMRWGDFLKIICQERPYGNNPTDLLHYLRETLKRHIADKTVRLLLVEDSKANEALAERFLRYETIATIGDGLAIRRTKDFEIAWSYSKDVIGDFNMILDNFVADGFEITKEFIDHCCEAIETHNQVGASNWKTGVLEHLGALRPDLKTVLDFCAPS
jgi:transcriptional regulator with XRE-family HTH domain